MEPLLDQKKEGSLARRDHRRTRGTTKPSQEIQLRRKGAANSILWRLLTPSQSEIRMSMMPSRLAFFEGLIKTKIMRHRKLGQKLKEEYKLKVGVNARACFDRIRRAKNK